MEAGKATLVTSRKKKIVQKVHIRDVEKDSILAFAKHRGHVKSGSSSDSWIFVETKQDIYQAYRDDFVNSILRMNNDNEEYALSLAPTEKRNLALALSGNYTVAPWARTSERRKNRLKKRRRYTGKLSY